MTKTRRSTRRKAGIRRENRSRITGFLLFAALVAVIASTATSAPYRDAAMRALGLPFITSEQNQETARHESPAYQAGISVKPNGGRAILLSNQRIQHILYGDETGGGHKHGVNKPCKSEFPADWNDRKIIEIVNKIAANDNMNWKRQENGYSVTETSVENLRIRVVVNMDKPEVITAYPVNVPRNPCPANDNNP